MGDSAQIAIDCLKTFYMSKSITEWPEHYGVIYKSYGVKRLIRFSLWEHLHCDEDIKLGLIWIQYRAKIIYQENQFYEWL